jgi:hypothetical protein
MLFGVQLGLVGIFVSSGEPTDGKCFAFPLLLAISFGTTMGVLLAKTWRINLIFDNPYLKN